MKTLRKLKPYLDGSKGLAALSLLFAFLATGSKLAIPLLAGRAVNEMASSPIDFDVISVYVIAMSVLLVVGTLFRYAFDYSVTLIGQNVVKRMRLKVSEAYLEAPVSYIDKHTHGDLLLRLVNDVENVQNGLISGAAALYDGIIAILFTIGFMFYINWVLALIVVCLTPLSVLMSRFVSRWNNKYFRKQAESAGSLTGVSLESLNNDEAVRTLGIEKGREAAFRKVSDEYRGSTFKATFGAALINPTTRLVNNIINAVVISVGAVLIVKDADIGVAFAVGDLSAFIVYASTFTQPFNEVSSVIAEISYAVASFNRIEDAVGAPRDADAGTKEISGGVHAISAEDVRFSYDPGRPIIKGVSLKADKGEKIALVGPTGCGKTTMINLLMRFYDPDEGSFYVNDDSTLDIKKRALRSKIGMVLQDTWIFSGTVYENIAYAKEGATREEVIEAAKRAQADSFIRRLPDGYDTKISDTGGLSVGEKQLICVARVMLLSPEVVILDEATSNIDVRTEYLLSQSFDRLMEGKTSFVVAHRLSTIVGSDMILVMKGGEIVERGTHKELLARKGFYYSLYNSQFEN
jgi:ATP-binding cassette subfamily B protein